MRPNHQTPKRLYHDQTHKKFIIIECDTKKSFFCLHKKYHKRKKHHGGVPGKFCIHHNIMNMLQTLDRLKSLFEINEQKNKTK